MADITAAHRQQLEQEESIRLARDVAEKASTEKSIFLSSMSHDLRTPLNAVLGFTDFAIKEDDSEKKDEYLAKINSSEKLLLELVNDTLDLSRIESGKMISDPEAVMTDDLVPSVVTSLIPSAELKGVELIEKHSNYKNRAVWADKFKINKIALNLLSNAIKFTPAGGKITVILDCKAAGNDKESYNFIIEDTGIGMSKEFMKRMYEPFAQEKRSESVKYPGTGLGLSIVKYYVDILGGTVEVESHLHKGTRWTVKIPVIRLQHGLSKKPQEEFSIDLQGKRILLCEDNYMNMEIAATLLKDKGIIVESAEDGAIAVKMFSKSELGYYDAVLMDIQMPVMNGYEATEKIRGLDRADAKKVTIIAMTADAFEESIRKAKGVGMNSYIVKPIDPQKMFEIIQTCLSVQKSSNNG